LVLTCPEVLIHGNHRDPNPFSFAKEERNFPYGATSISSVYKPTGASSEWRHNGHFGFGGTFDRVQVVYDLSNILPVSTESVLYNQLISRLYDQIRHTDLNALVTAAESRELASLKKQALDSVKKLGKVARGPLRFISAAAAGAWLTWSYAVKPAINDTYEYMSFTRSLLQRETAKRYASVSQKDTYALPSNGIAKRWGKAKYKGSLTYQVDDPGLFDLSRMGFTSPATFVWELIPFSFVIDWVFNVGNYLQNMEASYGVGLSFNSGWLSFSYKSVTESSYDTTYKSYDDSTQVDVSSASVYGNVIRTGMSRSVLSSFPMPRTPSLDLDLASSQFLSGAALLRTLFLK